MNDHNVQILSDPQDHLQQENLYLELRRQEGRIPPDEQVKILPKVSPSSPYVREWKWRERTLNRFLNRFPKNTSLQILDLGCGNGWMANKLATNPNWTVWAVDLNQEELEQGARLFGKANLKFIYADVFQGVLPERHFDVILLAASVQYFPNLTALLEVLRNLLNFTGEIHILDSNFYQNEDACIAARQRTLAYYTAKEMPEMARFYHHHLWPEAEKLGAENLNAALKIRFLQKTKYLAPFPWLWFK